jgi:hypothetical protein
MTFSKAHQVAPNVGFRVASNNDAGPSESGVPFIHAAEGSTVIYAAPGATIGSLGGGVSDLRVSDLLRSELFWLGVIGVGFYLFTRRSPKW